MISDIIIQNIGHTLETAGEIILGITLLKVHNHVSKERKIDKHIIKEMKFERRMGFMAILFIFLGYVLQIIS